MKTKAYSYVRFSTLDQLKGDSQRRQTEAAADWCRRHDIQLVDSYQDLGVSAFKGKNAETGALSSFLELVRKGKIQKGSYLIVESLDRVSRNEILDALELFTSIIKAGIVIVTLSDAQVYDREKINANPMQLMISLTVMTRAHEESKIKAQRVGAAWAEKRKNIDKEKLTGRCVAWLKLSEDRKNFEVIPSKAAVVKRIFKMVLAGAGKNSIAKTFNLEKVPTFGRAKVWHTSYVQKILESRAVIGEFAPATQRGGTKRTFLDPVPNYYPAVVDREAFATVQQLRKARPSYPWRDRGGFNVFSQLAFDAETNTPMAYVNKKREKGWHYLVSYAALNQQADYRAWQYDEFLGVFLLVCQNAALQPQQTKSPDTSKLDLARMELDETEKQIARLLDFLMRGTGAAVENRLRELEAKKLELEKSINDFESETLAKPADVSKVDWKDRAALRENLRATVKRISVDAAKKSFRAQFLDGREYAFSVEGKQATIQLPDGESIPIVM